MMQHFITKTQDALLLRPANTEDLASIIALCDECVGKNLYTRDRIKQAIETNNEFFYVLQTQAGEIVGYIYFLLADIESIALSAKVEVSQLTKVCQNPPKIACKIQSVGIRSTHRNNGLAVKMIQFALEQMKTAQVAYAVCWKMGETVPLEKSLRECGFSFLIESKKVWYEEPQLYCPHCKGRCHCDAEIYYKLLV